MLSIRDLVTSYGNIEALRGISLDAAEGEVTCLLGPNGAGKTTTLFTIAGILTAKSGAVVLNGEDMTRLRAAEVVSRGIALVPENRLVFPRMDIETTSAPAPTPGAPPRRRSPPTSRTCTGVFPAWRNARISLPAPCPEASSRCWPSPGA